MTIWPFFASFLGYGDETLLTSLRFDETLREWALNWSAVAVIWGSAKVPQPCNGPIYATIL